MQFIKTLAAVAAAFAAVSSAHAFVDLSVVRKVLVVPHVVNAVAVDGVVKAAEDSVNAGLQTLLSR